MRFIAATLFIFAFCLQVTTALGEPCGKCQAHSPCPGHECVKTHELKQIKKTIYEVKCVPVCEHRPAKFLDCDCCPICELKYKRVLVKREVVVNEVCTTKCVPVELPCNCCKE